MKIKGLLLLSLFLQTLYASAGIMPSQSRIVYHAQDKEQSLMLANTNDYPVIVQNWVDNGEGTPEASNIPFVSVPPILRMEKADVQGVRVIYNRTPLPGDTESLFWFNIYEIPPEKKGVSPDNSVLVTMNTQIKLFYRPAAITIQPEEAIKQLTCTKQSVSVIECSNPSPIYLSVIDIKIGTDGGKVLSATDSDLMLAPKSKKSFNFNGSVNNGQKLIMVYLNDFGEKLSDETNRLN